MYNNWFNVLADAAKLEVFTRKIGQLQCVQLSYSEKK